MKNDLISRSALIEEIKAEIENLTKEKQDYSERGIYHNMHMMGEQIKGAKSVLKIVENQPTAYDVEKVIQQLDDVLYDYTSGVEYYIAGDKMEQIVRNGGKE